jgi:ACR3 family arsenite efflux pump ArsB
MNIVYYTYFRIYSWYKKNQLTTVPETFASGILMLMFLFVGLLICYWLVRLNYLGMPNVTALAIFIITPLILSILIEKWMKNKIGEFRRKWQREQCLAKKIKGYVIAAIAIASFVGVALIANAFHELGLSKR